MSRLLGPSAVVVAAALTIACGGGSDAAPAPPPGVDLDALLREAGTPSQLCIFASQHPGTPQAAQARAGAAQRRQGARERFAAEAELRGTHPTLRAFVDTVIAAGEHEPCQRLVVVHVARELPSYGFDDPAPGGGTVRSLLQYSTRWAPPQALAGPIEAALREMEPAWLGVIFDGAEPPAELSSAQSPTLVVRYSVAPSGYVGSGTTTYPAIQLHPSIEMFVPPTGGQPAYRATLAAPAVTLDHGFTVRWYGHRSDEPAPMSSVLDEMISLESAELTARIPRFLGLRPADPAMAPFAGRWRLEGSAVADGCGGEIVMAAQHVTVDAAGHTMVADVVDRTYHAQVVDGRLLADVRTVAEGACAQSSIVERWDLATVPGGLSGRLDSTWLLPPACAEPCTISFDVRMTRAAD